MLYLVRNWEADGAGIWDKVPERYRMPGDRVGEVRVRMFREPESGMKGGRLRCVDIAEAGRGQVMD